MPCVFVVIQSSVDTALSVLAENVDCFETGVICRKSLLITIGRSTIAFEDDTGKPVSALAFFQIDCRIPSYTFSRKA